MRSFYTDEATRLRYPTVDDNGTDIPDWAAEPESEVIVGRFQFVSTSEDMGNRISTDTIARWLGDADVDLLVTDRLSFGDVTYEPTGSPLRHRSPNGLASHSDTPLRLFRG